MTKKNRPPKITKERRDRMAKALQLREQGATYDQIATTLGISRTRAYDDVMDALKEITREPAESVLKVELRRIDKLWQVAYRAAISGDMRAMDRTVKLMDRRIRLHGLDIHHAQVDVEVIEKLQESFTLLDAAPLGDLDPEGTFDN